MASINPTTALVLLYLLDTQAFYTRILRYQLSRQRELLRRIYALADTAPAFPADVKRDLAAALEAGDDALAFVNAGSAEAA